MNKQRLWYLASICVCAGLCGACDDDSGKKSDLQSPAGCEQPGYVRCDGTCIDPKTEIRYCGANDQCRGFKRCYDDESCRNGDCVPNNTPKQCNPATKPSADCTCNNGDWDCPHVPTCDPATKPAEDCECEGTSWKCSDPDICDPALKTSEDCECEGGSWNCPAVMQCSEADKTDEDCVCEGNNWVCPDAPAIQFNLASGYVRAMREGESVPFDLSLNRAPKDTVVVRLSSDAASGIEIAPDNVEFTQDNWETPTTIMVHSTQDHRVTGDWPLTVHAASEATNDSKFNGLTANQTINMMDIDECKLLFDPSENLQTSEDGKSQAVEVWLSCIPDSAVIYSFASDNDQEGEISSGAQLSFSTDNWNVPQTLTIDGVDDETMDGAIEYHIIATPDPANPAAFGETRELTVVNLDNEKPDINVDSHITVIEGANYEIAVSLATQPASDVAVSVISDDTKLSFTPLKLTFTPENYKTEQTITVLAANDDIVNGDRNAEIVLSAQSDDENYNINKPLDITVTDDDTAAIVYDPPLNSATAPMSECCTIRYKYLKLSSKPSANVTVTLSVADGTPIGFSPNRLTFTPSNWNKPQSFQIQPFNDGIVQAEEVAEYDMTYTAESSDTNYQFQDTERVGIQNTNRYELILSDPNTPISETGKGTISVKLAAKPSPSATVTITSSDPTVIKPSKSTVTFSSSNWNSMQSIEYTAVDNNIVDLGGSRSAYLTFVVGGSDSNFKGKSANSKTITVKDDETPSIIVSKASTADLDCASSTNNSITFNVSLSKQPARNLPVSIKSAQSTHKLSTSTLTFTPSNFGTSQTVTASCSTNNSATNNFLNNTVTFTSGDATNYPAPSVSQTYGYYPIGKSMQWTTPSNNAYNKTLVPGYYNVTVVSPQGGGNDNHGGYGGKVSTQISLTKAYNVLIYVGGKGSRGPEGKNDTNNSAGVGAKRGGKGDYGTRNWTYGGGGSSELRLTASCRSIVAGAGGGSTAYLKDAWGWGGKGGCIAANDSDCYGRDKNGNDYSTGATMTSGQGEDCPLGDTRGGGGAGYLGGSIGSGWEAGGNGGTSNINNTCEPFFYNNTTYTKGFRQGDGYVQIDVVK